MRCAYTCRQGRSQARAEHAHPVPPNQITVNCPVHSGLGHPQVNWPTPPKPAPNSPSLPRCRWVTTALRCIGEPRLRDLQLDRALAPSARPRTRGAHSFVCARDECSFPAAFQSLSCCTLTNVVERSSRRCGQAPSLAALRACFPALPSAAMRNADVDPLRTLPGGLLVVNTLRWTV
jgi:hypothetical protein